MGYHVKSQNWILSQQQRWTNVDPNLAPLKSLYGNYKRRAEKKGKGFNLTLDEFSILIKDSCHYCGIEPNQIHSGAASHRGSIIYNGIDRIDSKEGYVKDNVVTCCKRCNAAKNDMTYTEFVEWIKRVHSRITK